MRRYSLLVVTFIIAASAIAQSHQLSKEIPFQPGEKIEMRATVGFVRAAEATFSVSDVIYTINKRPTWKIDINAKTVGIFEFFSSVRDNWGSYYDTTSLVPQQFYRYIKEGRFRKNEILYFNHTKDSVTVAKLHKETLKLERSIDHAIPDDVQDMVSGYYYLRSIDFSKLKEGDIITINTFFDDKQKPFSVKFMGREVIDTKYGDVRALVLIPMMKKDSLFEEDNTLKIWLSDDLNKIPLKLQAKIYVGYLNVELQNVENLRHPLSIIN